MTVTRCRRRPAVLASGIGLIAFALVAAGCSSSNSSSSSDASSSATPTTSASTTAQVSDAARAAAAYETLPTHINVTTPLAKQPTPGTSAMYLHDQTPADQLAGQSACAALESVKWTCGDIGYNSADPASYQAAVRLALQKGAKYLMDDGEPPSLLGTAVLSQICADHAYLVAASVYPNETSGCVNTIANGGPSRTNFAKALAMWFIADSNGKGDALVETVSQYPVLYWFATQFVQFVKADCSGCKATIMPFTGADLANGTIVPSLVTALRADRSYNYLIFDYADFSAGITTALAAADITNVKVAGTGLDADALAELKAGKESAWVAQSWFQEGYAMADVSLRLETGSSGIDETAVTPMELITTKNTGDVNGPGNEWNGPSDALAQFQKLWNVG
jgi:ribose transport system substrate-binding protein